MKKVIATLALAILAFAPAMAGDVTYVAGMTGVTWGGCKRSVSSAFEKLEGFKSIKIEKGEKSGTQKVTVVTDGTASLTKEDAVKSLGRAASRYVVVDWAAEGSSASAGESASYIVTMTGVTWGGCKRSVSSAFEQLEGFESIKIEKGDAAGTQKVTVVTDGTEVTKEAAVAALGDNASKYVVTAVAKEGAES